MTDQQTNKHEKAMEYTNNITPKGTGLLHSFSPGSMFLVNGITDSSVREVTVIGL